MISEGTTAPGFELPALVDSEQRRVSLDSYLGEDVVILAFYPADFNPACDETSCDLDELDLFTMQKDVTILGISPDSVYSHRAFADTYDLNVPLLSDTDHDVAREYGIDLVDEIGQQLIERAVAVVGHDGVVQYAWSTSDLQQLPNVEAIKDAIADTGGDDTAFARYRVGHAHYTEARRAFTSAMRELTNSEWMMAQGDFQQAREEFDEAKDHFDTAVRFVDDPDLETVYNGAKTKAGALWQASDWLTQSASAYSSGEGAAGQELREDAERPLETARELHDPPDPDEWPPEVTDLEKEQEASSTILPQEDHDEPATLGVDIDAEVDGPTDQSVAETQESADRSSATESDDADDPAIAMSDDDLESDEQETVDDAELDEIQAELAANNPESEPSTETVLEESTSMVETPPETGSRDEQHRSGPAESRAESYTADGDEASTDDGDDETFELSDPTDADDEEP